MKYDDTKEQTEYLLNQGTTHNDPKKFTTIQQRPTMIQIKSTATQNNLKQYKKSSQRPTTTHNNPEKFTTTYSDPKQSTIIHNN